MEALMREKQIPLYSLETKHPVKEFDVFGFTLQYEMCYTNVLNMLDLAGIPLLSKDRTEEDPLIVAGGPCVYNAEPLADFIDAFFIGESEEAIGDMADTVKAWKKEGRPGGRQELVRRMAGIEGIYVPAFYEPKYGRDGRFLSLEPLCGEAAFPVKKRRLADVESVPWTTGPCFPMWRPFTTELCWSCSADAAGDAGSARRG